MKSELIHYIILIIHNKKILYIRLISLRYFFLNNQKLDNFNFLKIRFGLGKTN